MTDKVRMEGFIVFDCDLSEFFARNTSTFKLSMDGGVMHGNKVFSLKEVQQFI
jgi:hypothetical protein